MKPLHLFEVWAAPAVASPSRHPFWRAFLVRVVWQRGRSGERLSTVLHICTACDSALSAPSLVFITSGSFISASVLPQMTVTAFFFQFTSYLPCFLQNVCGMALSWRRGPSQRCFFCVYFDLTSLHSSEDILHLSHASCFLPTLFLLLLHLLLSFVQDFLDCSRFALRTYPSKRVKSPSFSHL